jgi:hypothetical protein
MSQKTGSFVCNQDSEDLRRTKDEKHQQEFTQKPSKTSTISPSHQHKNVTKTEQLHIYHSTLGSLPEGAAWCQ